MKKFFIDTKKTTKRLLVVFLIVFCSLAAIKIYELWLGEKILGDYTNFSSPQLRFLPQKRIVEVNSGCPATSSYPVGDIAFNLPSTDTALTYKKGAYYKSFKFKDNSHLTVFKDTSLSNPLKALPQINYTDSVSVKDFIREKGLATNFDMLNFIYNSQPQDMPFISFSRKDVIIQYTLLKLKDINLVSGADRGFYYFKMKHVRGFQYGNPKSIDKVFVDFFTEKGDKYTALFSGFTQEKIDCLMASIDKGL